MSNNCPNNNHNLSPVRENGEALREAEQRENVDSFNNLSVDYKEKKKFMNLYEIENNMTKALTNVLSKTDAKHLYVSHIEYEIKREMRSENIVNLNDKIYNMSKRICQRIKDLHIPVMISHENTLELYTLENDILQDFFSLLQVEGLKHKNIMGYLGEIKSKIAKEISSKNLLDEKRITNMALRIIQCVSDSIFGDSSKYVSLVVLNGEAKQEVHTPNCLDNEFDKISNKSCEINSELNQKEMGKLSTENKKLLTIERLKRDIKKNKIDSDEFDDVKVDSMANRIYELVEDLSKVESTKHRSIQYSIEKNYTYYLLEKIKKTDIRDMHKVNNIELIKRALRNELSVKQIPLSDEGIEKMAKRIFQRMNDVLLCCPSYLNFVRARSDEATGRE